MNDSCITVVLVEDNPLHVQRYRENLQRDPRLRLVAEFGTAREAIEGIGRARPRVALVDLGLPDASGLEVLRHVRDRLPATASMVVSVFGDERNLLDAIEAGATGYLLKDSLPDDFNASIHALCAGESPISPALARHLLRRLRHEPEAAAAAPPAGSPLSQREQTILEAIARGETAAEIGERLFISPLTVKTHVQNIYRKLEARSRQHAVYVAQRKGLLRL